MIDHRFRAKKVLDRIFSPTSASNQKSLELTENFFLTNRYIYEPYVTSSDSEALGIVSRSLGVKI